MSRDDNIDDPKEISGVASVSTEQSPQPSGEGDSRGLADEPDDAMADIDLAEAASARSFAQLVDRMIGGADLPPALESEEHSLITIAGLIQASIHPVELTDKRRDTLIDEAIARATATRTGQPTQQIRPADGAPVDVAPAGRTSQQEDRTPGITDLASYRRKNRLLPWTVAGLAAAAALILVLIRPDRSPDSTRIVAENQPIPTEQQSRPSDSLIGEIPRADVGQARERIDRIYADRMSGYRARHFGGVR